MVMVGGGNRFVGRPSERWKLRQRVLKACVNYF
jgi:hypothetical protein